MISIRECSNNWQNIKKIHSSYINVYVKNRINFYIDVFNYLEILEVKKNTRKITVNNKINKIGRKYRFHWKHTVTLINQLLPKNEPITKVTDYYILKYTDKFIPEAIEIDDCLDCLHYLREVIDNLVNLSFPIDRREYMLDKLITSPISFLLNSIIDYEAFSKGALAVDWNAYELTKKLNLKTCVYCNRNYTFTVMRSNKGVTRPEIDHFYDKARNPLLALTFENLIPSCSICNRDLKSTADFVSANSIINPYEENEFHKAMKFRHYPRTYEAAVGLSDEIDFKVINCEEPKTNRYEQVDYQIQLFEYKDIYSHHADYIEELILKKWVSNNDYMMLLMELYEDFNLSKEEAYRIAFGNFLKETDFSKRPLAKMIKDIAEQLGLILD